MSNKISFVFFGTAPLATGVLDALLAAGYVPSMIVAGPDRLDARKKTVIFPPEKSWALAHDVDVLQPHRIDADFIEHLKTSEWDCFVVASYGKILPQTLLDIPRRGVLNVHPSLLPRLRGPSPIRSAILTDERETGVSVMLLDAQMDHGPIIAQKKIDIPDWPPHGKALDELLAVEGGKLLAEYLPRWITGEVEVHEQPHELATYCTMIKKEDGLIDLSADAYHNLLKIRAYEGWPGTYTYFDRQGENVRVKILDAHFIQQNDLLGDKKVLVIDRVIPEGRREMSYEEFIRGS